MADIGKAAEMVLNEVRTEVLGLEILLGFQFMAVFRPGFDALSGPARHAAVASMGLMLMSLAGFLSSVTFHEVAERGRDRERLFRYLTRAIAWSLLPFAVGLGLAVAIALSASFTGGTAAIIGAGATALALVLWYGIEYGMVLMTEPGREAPETPLGTVSVEERLRAVLVEIRVILPGIQALLGFQLSAYLSTAFSRLDETARVLHTFSVGAMVVAVVLLMAPPAYHRIVEHGRSTPNVERVAAAMMLTAMAFFAVSLSVDFYVMASRATGSLPLSVGLAAGVAALFAGLWLVLPLLARR